MTTTEGSLFPVVTVAKRVPRELFVFETTTGLVREKSPLIDSTLPRWYILRINLVLTTLLKINLLPRIWLGKLGVDVLACRPVTPSTLLVMDMSSLSQPFAL